MLCNRPVWSPICLWALCTASLLEAWWAWCPRGCWELGAVAAEREEKGASKDCVYWGVVGAATETYGRIHNSGSVFFQIFVCKAALLKASVFKLQDWGKLLKYLSGLAVFLYCVPMESGRERRGAGPCKVCSRKVLRLLWSFFPSTLSVLSYDSGT